MNLARRLQARLEAATRSRPAEVTRALTDSIMRVQQAAIAEGALTVGDHAPSFSLPDALGRMIAVDKLRERGPVVICFYRGGWCPYCNLELRAYQEILPLLSDADTAFVAISPDNPDDSLTTSERLQLEFPVLTDTANRVAAAFRILHPVRADVLEIYRGNGVDLASRTGQTEQGTMLPLPATFLVDRHGIIRYSFVSPDYAQRAEPTDVLEAARWISREESRNDSR